MTSARDIFITGGTSGIGAAIARAFAAADAHVTATGATTAEVQAAQAHGPNAGIAFEVLDVQGGDAVKARLGQYDGLDVLVNCAGIIQRQVELEPEAFARTVDINLNGTMRACAAARDALTDPEHVVELTPGELGPLLVDGRGPDAAALAARWHGVGLPEPAKPGSASGEIA